MRASEEPITTTLHMKNVKSKFNEVAGIKLILSGDSQVTLNNVDASYTTNEGSDGFDIHFVGDSSQQRVTLKGVNNFNENSYRGFRITSETYMSSVLVSKGSVLNANKNGIEGLILDVFPGSSVYAPTFTIEKGGAVNACGNGGDDIVNQNNNGGKPLTLVDDSKSNSLTCDSIKGDGWPDCKPCPDCDAQE